MPFFIQAIFSLLSIGVAIFVEARWAPWAAFAPTLIWFSLIFYATTKTPTIKGFDSLSNDANELLQKHIYFYTASYAGTNFSSASSLLGITGVVVGIAQAFGGFYIGLLIGILLFVYSIAVSKALNPTKFLVNDQQKSAHNEIVEYIKANYEHERNNPNLKKVGI